MFCFIFRARTYNSLIPVENLSNQVISNVFCGFWLRMRKIGTSAPEFVQRLRPFCAASFFSSADMTVTDGAHLHRVVEIQRASVCQSVPGGCHTPIIQPRCSSASLPTFPDSAAARKIHWENAAFLDGRKWNQTNHIDIANYCRAQFESDLHSTNVEKRSKTFVAKYRSCDNVIW